jgi:hypothetical protein
VLVYLGNGDGTFGAPSPVSLPNPGKTQWDGLHLGDWNGDGKPDLIVLGRDLR